MILVLLLGPSVAIAENCICDDIPHIKTLPIKDERVKDDTYNKLISDASQSKSCLVESITDATLMRDPRQAPFYVGTTVGDVALFVLLDIEKSINLKDVLPEANLKETLELDSLDFVDLVVSIETNFGVKLIGEDFINVVTLQDFYDLIENKLS